jgi:hypothetical protein
MDDAIDLGEGDGSNLPKSMTDQTAPIFAMRAVFASQAETSQKSGLRRPWHEKVLK